MTLSWNVARVTEGLRVIQKSRGDTLTILKELINGYHNVSQNEDYYDLIAGDWLESFIHLTYSAWQNVLAGEARVKEIPIPVVADSRAFARSLFDPSFHEYWNLAVRKALDGVSPSDWRFSHDSVTISSGRSKWQKSNAIGRIISTRRPELVLCHTYYRCSHKDWISSLWRWRRWAKWDNFDYPISFPCPINQNWRRARAAAEFPIRGFSSLLRVLLPLHVPAALLEGLASLRNAAVELKLWRPRALYTANALHGHLTFKVLAAEWRKEGTLLLNHQHGGGYGIDRVHVPEEYESRVADRFYSWGWQRSDRTVKPMSIPSSPKYDRVRRRVLLICVDFSRTVIRLQFHPMPGTIETLVRETATFVSELSPNSELLIRSYPVDYGWGMTGALQTAAPWATFDDERPNAFQRYAESRMVVHSYLGTSWLETLALDIPTVCFFDPDTYAFRAEAQPYIDALERVGILHRSGRDAARFVVRLWNDPGGWWQSEEVQSARLAFVERYANFSQDWANQWEQEFGELLG